MDLVASSEVAGLDPEITGRAASSRRRLDWGGWAAVGVGIYALTYMAWTLTQWDLGGYSSLVNDLADFPVLIVAIVLMWRASGAVAEPNVRRGWRLLAVAYASLLIANAINNYLRLVLDVPAFPSFGDLFYLAFFPCAFLGMLSFPERLGARDEKITFALDAATLMVGGGTIILHFVILPAAAARSTMHVALASTYPLVDMVLVLGAVVVMFRNVPHSTRRALQLLATAFVVLFVADLVYSRDTLADEYVGLRVTDSLWTLSYAGIAIAAFLQHRAAGRTVARAPEHADVARRRLSSRLPLAAVLTSLAVLLFEAFENWDSSLGVLVISMVCLVALVGARQMIAIRENSRIFAENTMRANEARFRALVQQSSDVICIVDSGGVVRYISPSVERVLGFVVTELEGTRLLDLAHPDDRGAVQAFVTRLVDDPAAKVATSWRQRHKSGRWLHVEVVGTNGLAEPTIAGVVLNARDISERVQLERELEQARADSDAYQAQLLHAQKMEAIGRLAGGVAHDMNNALAAIIGAADCMVEDATTPEGKADAESILLSARRGAELTRNLLGFARRDAYRHEPLRPESLITSVVAMLARTISKGITIETAFGDKLTAIEGDPSQFSHALVNLCLNAVDAMNGHGVLTLGAHLQSLDAEAAGARSLTAGDHVVLSVRDTGVGMDATTRGHLFEPFFTTKDPGQGTGLGLAMVYGTVKRHSGAIEVDSTPGEGSTFRIFLPASAKSAELVARRPARAPTPRSTVSAGRVLIVDDEPLLRTTLQRVLERRGFDVMVAAHGQEGLDVLARECGRFDVVLLDMAMPVMAGPEMFRCARAAYPGLRVLLTSGFTSGEDARALLLEGAFGLVAKPVPPAVLIDAISVVMRDQRVDSINEAEL